MSGLLVYWFIVTNANYFLIDLCKCLDNSTYDQVSNLAEPLIFPQRTYTIYAAAEQCRLHGRALLTITYSVHDRISRPQLKLLHLPEKYTLTIY